MGTSRRITGLFYLSVLLRQAQLLQHQQDQLREGLDEDVIDRLEGIELAACARLARGEPQQPRLRGAEHLPGHALYRDPDIVSLAGGPLITVPTPALPPGFLLDLSSVVDQRLVTRSPRGVRRELLEFVIRYSWPGGLW